MTDKASELLALVHLRNGRAERRPHVRGEGFHVPSKGEADALVTLLNASPSAPVVPKSDLNVRIFTLLSTLKAEHWRNKDIGGAYQAEAEEIIAALGSAPVVDRAAIIEECARVAEERAKGRFRLYAATGASINASRGCEAEEIASAIRARITSPSVGGE